MTGPAPVGATPLVPPQPRPVSRMTAVGLAVLVLAALALRLWNLPAAPANFHSTRQYAGLALAKAWSGAGSDDAARRAAIEANARSVPRLEPRILEAVVAGGYRLFGQVEWLAGLISSLLWCAGGLVLFLLARRLASDLAAWVAAGFHLFLPYGVEAGRSFQPDPAMVTFILAALLALVVYAERPSARLLVVAAALGGAAVLLKPVAGFFVGGAFVALAVSERGLRAGLLRRETVVFAGVGLVPSASYYVLGMLGGGDLSSFASSGLLPSLWFDAAYWRGWLRLVQYTVAVAMLLPALAALVVARRRVARHLLAGLFGGYVVFCLVFTYHVQSHDYYHLPLVPIVGLGLGLTVDAVAARLWRWEWSVAMKAAGAASLAVLVLSLAVADLRVARRAELSPDARRQLADAAAIGGIVRHSTRTVVLAPAYGLALFYEGDFSGDPWPTRGDLRFQRLQGDEPGGVEERFAEVTAGADWFVVTDFVELAGQPELRPLLDRHGRLVADEPGYRVYDLRP